MPIGVVYSGRRGRQSGAFPQPRRGTTDPWLADCGAVRPSDGLDVLDIPAERQAPSLILLHEALGSVGLWRDFPELLAHATGARTFVYSRHGHGRSAPPPGPRDRTFMDREALVVLPDLIARWGLEDPVLVGHSDGASIALLHAAHHDVRGVVAMAPHVFVEDVTLRGVQDAVATFQTTDLRDRMARHHDDAEATFRRWADVWLSEEFRDWDLRPVLGRITAPVLLVQGDADPYGTVAHVDAVASATAGEVERLVLPGGHEPQFEHRDTVAAAIADLTTAVGIDRRD